MSRSTIMAVRALGASLLVALAALAVPAAAGAATVVNGDFEEGLNGWQTQTAGEATARGWFSYAGESSPISAHQIPLPPNGSHAAISDQTGPASDILYQEVALEPFWTHQLTLTLFYSNWASAFFIPNPDTLSWTGEASEDPEGPEQANQQYRVDVMKAGSPVNSVNPSDILATVLATKPGDPLTKGPAQFSVDLTPFGGQTVRLRFAEVDNEFYFNAGVDNVSIQSTPPSNAFTLGKRKLNRKKGNGFVQVTVPGAGIVSLTDTRSQPRIKNKSLTATAAGTLKIPLAATGVGRKALKKKHTIVDPVSVAFTPTGGFVATKAFKAKLKLKPKPKRHRRHKG